MSRYKNGDYWLVREIQQTLYQGLVFLQLKNYFIELVDSFHGFDNVQVLFFKLYVIEFFL